jgi:DNA invertase Pin-like site-specific DNA recombinase
MKREGILYVRVSSDDQVRGVSLDDQTAAGLGWFARELPELEVRIYREEGESARTAKRTELTRALRYVAANPGRVEAFLVYDLSRFARNLRDQVNLGHDLAQRGVRLLSITQPTLEGPEGKFFAHSLGAMNQYVNEAQGRKISRCMLETVRRGRWPHCAPLGYRNGRDGRGEKIVEPDPATADLVRSCFERVAEGAGVLDTLRWVTARGLRGNRGGAVRPQDLRKILTNPFYAGTVRSLRHGVERRGEHEALVDEVTWSRVQARFAAGRGEPASVHSTPRPEFPLRGFVRCESCGRALTASRSRGKTGQRYGYYRCWLPTCGAVAVRAERLEAAVVERMGEIAIEPAAVAEFGAELERLWSAQAGESSRLEERATRRVAGLARRRERLIDAYALEGGIDQATFERRRQALEGELAEAHLELSNAATPAADLAALLTFAEPFLTGPSRLWQAADTERKRLLQHLAWPAGLTYGSEGLGTPQIASVFRLLGPTLKGEKRMVEQTAQTWNSIVAELLAIREALAA